jgi:hypothetical protein
MDNTPVLVHCRTLWYSLDGPILIWIWWPCPSFKICPQGFWLVENWKSLTIFSSEILNGMEWNEIRIKQFFDELPSIIVSIDPVHHFPIWPLHSNILFNKHVLKSLMSDYMLMSLFFYFLIIYCISFFNISSHP